MQGHANRACLRRIAAFCKHATTMSEMAIQEQSKKEYV